METTEENLILFETVMCFGKYKGKRVSGLIPEEDISDISETMADEFKEVVKYFVWVEENTQYTLSKGLKDQMRLLISKMTKSKDSHSVSNRNKLDYYNDIGSISDISFQDVYGDFGY
jgi:hypothetical protein